MRNINFAPWFACKFEGILLTYVLPSGPQNSELGYVAGVLGHITCSCHFFSQKQDHAAHITGVSLAICGKIGLHNIVVRTAKSSCWLLPVNHLNCQCSALSSCIQVWKNRKVRHERQGEYGAQGRASHPKMAISSCVDASMHGPPLSWWSIKLSVGISLHFLQGLQNVTAEYFFHA